MKGTAKSFLFLIILLLFAANTSISATDFKKDLYSKRRAELTSEISDGILVMFGSDHVYRNSDITYRYRQNSNFYYLTGLEDPGAIMVIIPGAEEEFILFLHKRNFGEILFGGEGITTAIAMEKYGADDAYTVDKFYEFINRQGRRFSKIYYDMSDEEFTEKITETNMKDFMWRPKEIINPSSILSEMRVNKDEEEIGLMKESVRVSCDAIAEVMRAAKPGMNERELEGIINYVWMKNGSPRYGYQPIIAAGKRSATLHYEANDGEIKNGDLVMMDVACEYGYYSADVTRTFPANGKFTKEQKELYDVALSSIDEGIKVMNPGVGWKEVDDKTYEAMQKGLYELGLVTDPTKKWQAQVYYSYGFGHYIGLDTHDVGDTGRRTEKGRLLEPGMIIAIEPGIYVDPVNFEKLPLLYKYLDGNPTLEEVTEFMDAVRPLITKYAYICVRAEDDILITEDGHINLSIDLARETEEIEALMAEETKYIKE